MARELDDLMAKEVYVDEMLYPALAQECEGDPEAMKRAWIKIRKAGDELFGERGGGVPHVMNEAGWWEREQYPKAGAAWSRDGFNIFAAHPLLDPAGKVKLVHGWTLRPFFGAHQPESSTYWAFTHLPSGRRIGTARLMTHIREVADWILEEIEGLGISPQVLVFSGVPKTHLQRRIFFLAHQMLEDLSR